MNQTAPISIIECSTWTKGGKEIIRYKYSINDGPDSKEYITRSACVHAANKEAKKEGN